MIGLRVLKRRRAVSGGCVSQFEGLPTANVSDCMSRMSAGGTALRPMHSGRVMAGPALTVKTRPGDNLMVHKALDLAQRGDVVVVDAGGDLTNAIVGELMISYAMKRELGGIVIFGAIRDSAWIREHDFPVFATGVTHRGPYKDGPGEINVPIALEGMVVEPGDLILGDADGVVSVPFDATGAVYQDACAKRAAEERQMEAIVSGTNDRSWVDASLANLGCEIEP